MFESNTNRVMNKEFAKSEGQKNSLFVCNYVDYTSKYGLGYLFTNGSSGVIFNDGTKIVIDSKGECI